MEESSCEAAFQASMNSLTLPELVPELRRVLAAARPLLFYRDSAALARLTNKVAFELYVAGVFVEAAPLFREALAEFTATLGAEHEVTVATAQNLGTCLLHLGRPGEALPLLESALAHLTRVEGEESYNSLAALQTTASVQHELGNLARAEKLLRQGQAALSRLAVRAGLPPHALPPGKVEAWSAFNHSLAALLLAERRLGAAESLLQGSLSTLADTPESAERNKWMTELSVTLGTVLQERGDLLGSEKLFRELLPKLQGKPYYGFVADSLGMVLKKRGLTMESRKYLDIAKRAESESFGANHRRTQTARLHRRNLNADLRTCAQCGPITDKALVMKVCSVCQAARYCGAACQKLHWKTHKPECKRIKAENDQVTSSSEGAGPTNA